MAIDSSKEGQRVLARHLIGAEWVDTPEHAETRDPYRGEAVATVAVGTLALMDRAVAQAKATAPGIAALPAYKRAAILHEAARLIEQRADVIGATMARETGKAVRDAVSEVRRSQDTMTLSAEEAVRIEGAQIPLEASPMGAGKLAFMTRFPVGVVGAITPFNAPFNLACHKLGPAFAAGNAVVLKPPPQAAGVVHMLVELMQDAGLPAGALNVVHGGIEMGQALVRDPRVDFITFTGSTRAGIEINAMSGLRRVALELGGAGQTILCEDADLATAAPMCARNAMRLAGQSCISVQTVLVHRSLERDFTDRLVAEVGRLRLGDPLEEDTEVGTLIDAAAAERVESWLDEAVAGGARILTGGKRTGAQLSPAVVVAAQPQMKIVCNEVFGPVVSVLAFDRLEEAIEIVNASPFGLQCGIFTASNANMLQAYRAIRTGGLIVNGTSTWRTDQLAYGGVKNSGLGREGPRYAIRDMTEERLLVLNM